MPFISFKDVSKSYKMNYGEIHPLQNITLTINKHEKVAIMGASGSGKTTLLSLLGCLDKPSEGEYFFEGKPVHTWSDYYLSAIRGKEIAYMFQDFQLISEMTVLENVMMPFRYKDVDYSVALAKSILALKKVKLDHRLDHYPYEISGGEMQRVAFARAIAFSPSLILADEPTGNLDANTAREILDLLFKANVDGTTVIVVTHDENLSKLFPRIIRLKEGKVISDVST